jgi:excisionase family DNA binding protein
MNTAITSTDPETVPTEPWVKTPDACKHLGISVPTLRRWVKDKRLHPKRTPTGEFRFRRSDLDAVLA